MDNFIETNQSTINKSTQMFKPTNKRLCLCLIHFILPIYKIIKSFYIKYRRKFNFLSIYIYIYHTRTIMFIRSGVIIKKQFVYKSECVCVCVYINLNKCTSLGVLVPLKCEVPLGLWSAYKKWRHTIQMSNDMPIHRLNYSWQASKYFKWPMVGQ